MTSGSEGLKIKVSRQTLGLLKQQKIVILLLIHDQCKNHAVLLSVKSSDLNSAPWRISWRFEGLALQGVGRWWQVTDPKAQTWRRSARHGSRRRSALFGFLQIGFLFRSQPSIPPSIMVRDAPNQSLFPNTEYQCLGQNTYRLTSSSGSKKKGTSASLLLEFSVRHPRTLTTSSRISTSQGMPSLSLSCALSLFLLPSSRQSTESVSVFFLHLVFFFAGQILIFFY